MPKVFLFADFRLDCKNWTLYRDDVVVDLPPKIIDTLIYLIERAGKVVSYEELTAHLWPGLVVEPGALRRNLFVIRNALDSEQPYRFIQTIKSRGLCFIAPVKVLDMDQVDAVAKESSSNDQLRISVIGPVRPFKWIRASIIGITICIAAAVIGLGVKWTLRTPVYVLKQLTSNSEELSIITAVLSPNANMIASSDGTRISITDVNATEWHSISLPGAKGSLLNDLEWFPDGIHLLVCSVDPGTKEPAAWSVSVLTGNATLVLRDASSAAPSPDGQHIVFMRNDNKQLWIADATGNNARLVYSDEHANEMTGPTYFSADGRYALLLHADTHHSMITAHNLASGKSRTVFQSNTQLGGFIPLKNGEILYAQYMSAALRGDQLMVSRVNLDSGVYAAPQVVASFPNDIIGGFSVAGDRRKILLTKSLIQSDIYVAPLSNHGTVLEQSRRLTSNDSDERPAEWMDNDTILMTSDRDGAFNVFSQKLDSYSVTPLTTGKQDRLRATLSADRNWLFYVIAVDQGNEQQMSLYRKSLRDGSEQAMYSSRDPTLLIHCAYYSNRCVLSEHTQDECVFYEFDPLQGRGKQLVGLIWSSGLSVHNWDLSRDGKRIALLDSENGIDTISILDLEHSPVRYRSIKINTPSPPHTLTWDAESNGFYVSTYTEEDTLFNLLHIGLDGTVMALRSERSSQDGWAIPSPDGKYLAYQKYESVGNLWWLERQ